MNSQLSTQAEKAPPKVLSAVAWGTILVLSAPQIVLNLLGQEAAGLWLGLTWLEWTQVVVLAVLWAVTWIWPIVKPLRGFALALLAYFA